MAEVSTVAPLLTPAQVADLLGVPEKTLFAWRARGRPSPRAVKVGRYLRFRPDDVREFIDSLGDGTTGGAA